MTRLRLGLSHLREHKFNHNFQNCNDPLCSCDMDIESTSNFFLRCPIFHDKRITLLNTLNKIDCKLIGTNESSLIGTLLFSNSLFDLKELPWWWWVAFVVWLTDERRLALFLAGTIVGDPHYSEFPTRREQGLNLRRAWVQV